MTTHPLAALAGQFTAQFGLLYRRVAATHTWPESTYRVPLHQATKFVPDFDSSLALVDLGNNSREPLEWQALLPSPLWIEYGRFEAGIQYTTFTKQALLVERQNNELKLVCFTFNMSKERYDITKPIWICNREVTRRSAPPERANAESIAAFHADQDELANFASSMLRGLSALLSADPQIMERDKVAPKVHRDGKGRLHYPYIEVKIGVIDGVRRVIEDQATTGIRGGGVCWHVVRGHPRTYKKSGRTIWIDPFTKGDPKKRIVVKPHYEVRTKVQPKPINDNGLPKPTNDNAPPKPKPWRPRARRAGDSPVPDAD